MAKRPTVEPRPATFSPEEMSKIISDLQAELARPLIKAVPVKAANNKAAENEWKTVKAFKKTYGTVTPHVDVLTFNKWVAQGLRPMEGEHATKVGALRLFHKSQTRPLTKEEAGEFAKKFAERAAADKAKIVSITEARAQQ
jgi:hypothetical protein